MKIGLLGNGFGGIQKLSQGMKDKLGVSCLFGHKQFIGFLFFHLGLYLFSHFLISWDNFQNWAVKCKYVHTNSLCIKGTFLFFNNKIVYFFQTVQSIVVGPTIPTGATAAWPAARTGFRPAKGRSHFSQGEGVDPARARARRPGLATFKSVHVSPWLANLKRENINSCLQIRMYLTDMAVFTKGNQPKNKI